MKLAVPPADVVPSWRGLSPFRRLTLEPVPAEYSGLLPAERVTVLDLGESSIDGKVDAVDGGGLVGGEERDGRCDLLRLYVATEGGLGGQAGEELVDVGVAGESGKTGRLGGAGADGVHADAAVAELLEPTAGEVAGCGLGRGIHAAAGAALLAVD